MQLNKEGLRNLNQEIPFPFFGNRLEDVDSLRILENTGAAADAAARRGRGWLANAPAGFDRGLLSFGGGGGGDMVKRRWSGRVRQRETDDGTKLEAALSVNGQRLFVEDGPSKGILGVAAQPPPLARIDVQLC